MTARFEITSVASSVRPGDLVVFRLVTKRGLVRWECGVVRCFTDDADDPAIVLNDGGIPEYDGYELVCCIKTVAEAEQLSIDGMNDE